ncbi:MAG: peptidoglycan-binding protein [Kiloniellales bacterium]
MPRVRGAALIGLALLLAGCARSHEVPVTPQAAAPPAAVAEPEAEIPPASAAEVKEAQGALAELGYEPGPVDGVEGPRTQAAVRAFQESADLTADGRVTEALLAALTPALETHRVTQAQRRVAALGYDPGPVDGKLGRHTRMAIKRFEADAGAEPQGKITPALFELLAKAEASQVQWMADDANDPPGDTAQLEQALSPAAGPDGQGAEQEAIKDAGAGQAKPLSARVEVAAVPGQEGQEASEEAAPDKRLILPGDTVRLRIGRDQIEVREFQVGLDGELELPEGVSLQAAGLTAKQLEDLIMVKLVEVYLMGLKVDVMPPAAEGSGAAGGTKAAEDKAAEEKAAE